MILEYSKTVSGKTQNQDKSMLPSSFPPGVYSTDNCGHGSSELTDREQGWGRRGNCPDYSALWPEQSTAEITEINSYHSASQALLRLGILQVNFPEDPHHHCLCYCQWSSSTCPSLTSSVLQSVRSTCMFSVQPTRKTNWNSHMPIMSPVIGFASTNTHTVQVLKEWLMWFDKLHASWILASKSSSSNLQCFYIWDGDIVLWQSHWSPWIRLWAQSPPLQNINLPVWICFMLYYVY